MGADNSPSDAFAKRIADLRKLFAKGLGHKPNRLEAMAILRAATLEAEAERVLADVRASPNDKVRITGAARHARRDLAAMLEASRQEYRPTLDQMLAEAES